MTHAVDANMFRHQHFIGFQPVVFIVRSISTTITSHKSLMVTNRHQSKFVAPSFVLYERRFAKDRNPELVSLSRNHVKHLAFSHIWQLWHVITFDWGRSGVSHLPQSSWLSMSSMAWQILHVHMELKSLPTIIHTHGGKGRKRKCWLV